MVHSQSDLRYVIKTGPVKKVMLYSSGFSHKLKQYLDSNTCCFERSCSLSQEIQMNVIMELYTGHFLEVILCMSRPCSKLHMYVYIFFFYFGDVRSNPDTINGKVSSTNSLFSAQLTQ